MILGTRPLFSLIVLFLMPVWGCDGEWKGTRIPTSVLETIGDRGRVHPVSEPDTLEFAFDIQLPDSFQERFQLRRPLFLSVEGPPTCVLAIGDPTDRAVHQFHVRGRHIRSVIGNGREGTPRLETLTSVDVVPDGSVVVTTADGRAHWIGSDGSFERSISIRPPRSGVSGFVSAIGLRSGYLFEHWFSGFAEVLESREAIAGSPLVRVWDPEGQVVSRFGTAREQPGESLTYFLNRGILAQHQDTIWFARRADARLLAFDMRGKERDPHRVLDLPVFFESGLPIEYVSRTGEVSTRLQEHIRGFGIDTFGNFYVVQASTWPDLNDPTVTFQPVSIVVVLDRDGARRGVYSTGSSPGRIAVTDQLIYTTWVRPGVGIGVRAFLNPTHEPDRTWCIES